MEPGTGKEKWQLGCSALKSARLRRRPLQKADPAVGIVISGIMQKRFLRYTSLMGVDSVAEIPDIVV